MKIQDAILAAMERPIKELTNTFIRRKDNDHYRFFTAENNDGDLELQLSADGSDNGEGTFSLKEIMADDYIVVDKENNIIKE